jgi:hypothetical protein
LDKKRPATLAAGSLARRNLKAPTCGVNTQADYLLLPPFLTVAFRLPLTVPWPLSRWPLILPADLIPLPVVALPTVRPFVFVPSFMPPRVSFVPLTCHTFFLQVNSILLLFLIIIISQFMNMDVKFCAARDCWHTGNETGWIWLTGGLPGCIFAPKRTVSQEEGRADLHYRCSSAHCLCQDQHYVLPCTGVPGTELRDGMEGVN